MSDYLNLNPTTRRYEATITIEIEEEVVQRAFLRYVEENHVDLSDLEAMRKAIAQVIKVSKWIDHPRTQKVSSATGPNTAVSPPSQKEEKTSSRRDPIREMLTPDEVEALRQRALHLPREQWETSLLTPLPQGLPPGKDRLKDSVYRRRSAERKVLEQVGREIEPARMETLTAIADAVNGVRPQ